mgnify:CR=1 FL=1
MTGPGRPAAHLKGRSIAEDRQGAAILPRDAKPTCRRRKIVPPCRLRSAGRGEAGSGQTAHRTQAAAADEDRRYRKLRWRPLDPNHEGGHEIDAGVRTARLRAYRSGSDMPACRSSVPCSAARTCLRPRPWSADRRRSRHPHGTASAPVRRCPADFHANAACMQCPMPFRFGSSQCAWFCVACWSSLSKDRPRYAISNHLPRWYRIMPHGQGATLRCCVSIWSCSYVLHLF